MVSSIYGYAGLMTVLSTAYAQTAQTYKANTNANCVTASDVDYQGVYSYSNSDTMDWGFYTQSQGTCDAGSYARVHVIDPSGNDISCGYVALDGNVNLVSCANYPRGYMQEGQYTVYWEAVPGTNQYSWNQFTVNHSQSTVTAPTPTQTVTTTPLTVQTTVLTNTPTETSYVPQQTITTPSATMVNTINVTPPVTTITTTSTSWISLVNKVYKQTTTTAVVTAACRSGKITNDYTAKRSTGKASSSPAPKVTRQNLLDWLARLANLRRRDGDVPNTVGMIGQPLTTTITPDAVMSTLTAATSTSIVTSTTNAPVVIVTSENPTPTVTIYSGVAVSTITQTLPQVTKSIVKNRLSLTMVTTTVTLTYTKTVKTTPTCTPTGK